MEEASATLTIYFDGQFYIGLFERIEKNKLSVCKYIFGAEPKDYEVYELILSKYYSLRFSPTVKIERKPIDFKNPKTRQRKIKETIANIEIGTKSQQAIKKQIEERKIEKKVNSKTLKEQTLGEKFQKRQKKRKEKHKGH
ncbi:MAG: YjdF family protein [Clostridia bacterium]|nr:YjdF family protein [Clostridia bacterium]